MPDNSGLPIGWYDGDDGVRRYWDGVGWRTPAAGPEQPATATEPPPPATPRWPEEPAPQPAATVPAPSGELPVFPIGYVLAVVIPLAGLLLGLWARREYAGSIRLSECASGIVKLSIGFLIAQTVVLAIVWGVNAGNSASQARSTAYLPFCSVITDNAPTFDAVIDWPHNHTTYDDVVNAYVAVIPDMSAVAQELRSRLPSNPDGAVTERLDSLDLALTGAEDSLADGSFLNSNQPGNRLRDSARAVRGLLDSRFCG